MIERVFPGLVAVLLGCAAGAALAAPGNTYYVQEVEWVEAAVPAAPAFATTGGIAIDMPRHVSVRVAVDPATLAIGSDGVVRYVAYMTNASGSVSAVYEGIRCTTDEVKTYARWNSSSGAWTPTTDPQWKEINGNQPSKHAWAFARQGGCDQRLAPRSVADMVRALKQPTRGSGRVEIQ